MRIGPAELVEDGETVLIRSLVEYRNTKDCLWYSVDKIYAEYLTREKLDAFLVGLLPLAMKIGEDIVLEGPVSKRLFYNLSNYYMRIVGSAFPHRGAVTITPASLDDGGSYDCAGAVVTGFSGGVDAFCTFREHHYRNLLPGYRLTHLLFSNVGSFWGGDTQRARALFNRRFELVKGLGEEAGLEFVKVDSNLSEVLRMRFVEAHPARNTSVALALQGLFGVFYYSSSFTYEDCTARNPYDVGQCDPMAMHLLSTESLQCISTCGQYS